jgi:hypothetical protein
MTPIVTDSAVVAAAEVAAGQARKEGKTKDQFLRMFATELRPLAARAWDRTEKRP